MDPAWLLLVALAALAGVACGFWLGQGRGAARAAREASLQARVETVQLAERLEARGREAAGAQDRAKGLEIELDEVRAGAEAARVEAARLREALAQERQAAAEKAAALDEAGRRLADTFRALAAEALATNNRAFLDLAGQRLEQVQGEARGDLGRRQEAIEALVRPLRESLERYERELRQIEQARTEAYGGLRQQLEAVATGQQRLQAETGSLVRALRTPQVRGRWGELTLRRVVELAGLTEHCDFVEQETVGTGDARLRPDLVVHLPGGRSVAVDAKAPIQAYLDALEAPDEETRRARLLDHARQTRQHVQALAGRAYHAQLGPAPDIVVLFLPAEPFFTAAVEHAPDLLEEGIRQAVFVATPTTLIALLRAVAFGWQQERAARSARAISELGRELHERLAKLTDHFDELRRALVRTVEAYNAVVGSVERRVLVTGRRLRDLGAGSTGEVAELDPVEEPAPRRLQAGDWQLSLPGPVGEGPEPPAADGGDRPPARAGP